MSSTSQLANAVQGARSIAAQGDKRGALGLLDHALKGASRSLGADDPDVLAATGQLARYHVELGELNDARRVLEEGLSAGQQRLGEGHAVMLGLSYELARIADELGNVFEAKRRYGQLARLGPQALGVGHPNVREAREYLGMPEPAAADALAPPPPKATFDPVSPPPATDGPIYVPEPRYEDHPTMSLPAVQPAEEFFPDEEDDQDDYVPAPWQQAAPGVFQRTDFAPPPPPPPIAPLPAPMPMPAPPPPPLPAPVEPPRRRSPMVALLVIVVLAVLGGGVAAAIAFFSAGPGRPAAGPGTPAASTAQAGTAPAGTAPTSAAAAGPQPDDRRAPGDLKLRDDKTSVTVTWTDPSKGTAPFIVAGGTQGTMRQLQALAAGTTKYTINGLNPKLDYCFTVAAVYGTSDVQLSDVVCTRRS